MSIATKTTMLYCGECIYCESADDERLALCGNRETVIFPNPIAAVGISALCFDARAEGGKCGPEGRLFRSHTEQKARKVLGDAFAMDSNSPAINRAIAALVECEED
ncbi:MAG: hypothetical protein OXC08_20710 [Thiotrichales bacterium]|nr:hypothetical protein [Thiotrichales bacterium]